MREVIKKLSQVDSRKAKACMLADEIKVTLAKNNKLCFFINPNPVMSYVLFFPSRQDTASKEDHDQGAQLGVLHIRGMCMQSH